MHNRLVIAGVAVAVAAICALLAVRPDAHASTAGDPRIAVLQTQVKALQKQVADLHRLLNYNWDGDACLASLTSDALQGTWIAVDQATQKATFGPQTQTSDYGTCEKLTNPDIPRRSPITTPPNVNTLALLTQWFGG